MGSIAKIFKKPAGQMLAEAGAAKEVPKETATKRVEAVKKRNAGTDAIIGRTTRARSRGRSSLISEDRSKTLG